MRRVGIIAGLAVLLLVLVAGNAMAQEEKKVVVKGEGVIFQGDKATAKEKAKDQALRLAVEQVVGIYIKSSTLVQNYVTVDDKILSQSKGYVKNYKILSEKVDGDVVVVEIEATVAAAKVKGDLDAIQAALSRKNYPRMMLMIAEQNVGQPGFSQWWGTTSQVVQMSQVENTLIDELGQLGFTFVDPQVLSGKIQMKDAYRVTSANSPISTEAAREIADLTDAQVVLVGTAVANNMGAPIQGSNMSSGQANINVRAINTDNGQILLSSSTHGAFMHIDPTTAGLKALKKAAQALAKEITNKLVDKWLSSSAMVTLEISGLANYRMLDDFKQVLSHQVGGVQGVYERKMRGDKAQIDLYYSGDTSLLAKELVLKKFKGFRVKIDEKTANKLKLTLSNK